MADKMSGTARGIHVSPGVYSREIDITYAVKSLGITTLGLAGETQKGPAFQPMHIENWREFVDNFGGTNPEKFKGSQYPKYELPYIAKSYLTESKQLEVVRVLGLSGYKAGPAWVVTAHRQGVDSGETNMAVAVLRSRGHYEKYHKFDLQYDSCECPNDAYDNLVYEVGEVSRANGTCEVTGYNDVVRLKNYTPLYAAGNECDDYEITSGKGSFNVSANNYGRFTVYGLKGYQKTGVTGITATMSGGTPDWKTGDTKDYYFEYPVSLNPYDKDYILKVLGTDPQDGDAPLYVESLYDVALAQGIKEELSAGKVDSINSALTFYNVYDPADYDGLEPISGMLRIQEKGLTRKNLGQRFVADKSTATTGETNNDPWIYAHPYDYATNLPMRNGDSGVTSGTWLSGYSVLTMDEYAANKGISSGTPEYANLKKEWPNEPVVVKINDKCIGQIFTVVQHTDETGKRHYYYRYYPEANVKAWAKNEGYTGKTISLSGSSAYMWDVNLIPIVDKLLKNSNDTTKIKPGNCDTSAYTSNMKSSMMTIVKNLSDGLYYRLSDDGNDVVYVSCDLNNYASRFRYASTPWIVSNLKGDYDHIELNKLFRFHTISDGNGSNFEVKVSIENIRPDDGTFDVMVRDINDTDEYVMPLERFQKCTLIPGDRNFIGFRIGTFDGMYESKSKYITVEVAEGTAVEHSAPAGFLGYPMTDFNGLPVAGEKKNVIAPILKYNRFYDNELKNRKQYFGLSTRVGVDIDAFTYKGKAAYIDEPSMLTNGFHLDARLDNDSYSGKKGPEITVDGEYGYKFDAVSVNNRTTILTDIPAIGTEALMQGSIYEYVDLRKFTVYFYGGFDGWDVYRDQRSNTDDFKMSKYLGTYDANSGEGYSFNRIDDAEELGLNQNGITSDWYAYLAAYRQFANPESVDINVFATPGIDYVNNKSLVHEVVDMIEEERADSIYVVTTPDKPNGAGDFVDEMYTPDDAVYNLEDSELNSNYACTYYPWVKYLDADNNQYIYLPVTKDVVRNFAQTDNITHPWFAPAGISRGDVNCVRAHYITKLADEDVLYEGRINPVKTFAQDGVKIWGQKNLQVANTQLDRINVRRLMLRMRKLIAIACRPIIFEQLDTVTKDTFLSTVTPILDNIRSNRGISDYRVEVDDSIEARERHELNCKIWIKPIGALEYISIDFILMPQSMKFLDE